jgi:hypothetical protein
MPFALLQVINRQFGDLVAPESTSKQESQQRTIAFIATGGGSTPGCAWSDIVFSPQGR